MKYKEGYKFVFIVLFYFELSMVECFEGKIEVFTFFGIRW